MSEKRVNIDDYILLHSKGIPLNKVRPIANQTYDVLKDSNVDVRIIDRDKNLALIYRLAQLGTFSKDTKTNSHRFFYSIPIQTVSGTIAGFIYRTVFDKQYTTVSRDFSDKEHKVPLMFGFYKDFADYDKSNDCKPIIVCEGLKDCITLKKIYPYVLSNNTSHMGINLQVLSNLTNKFILIYDSDTAGQEGTLADIAKVQKLKYDVIELKVGHGYKDVTDCSEDKTYFDNFKTQLLESIRLLETKNDGCSAIGRSSTNIFQR
jgi:DNA primase